MASIKPNPPSKSIRSLALWMAPPAHGWRHKGGKHAGSASRALMQPLAALGIILLMVGFVGLLIMQQSVYHSVLFQGIGDLQRQARYILDLSAPPTDIHRLRTVLDEFDSRLRRLTVDLRMPVTINETEIPWRSSPAQYALFNLSEHWQTVYRTSLQSQLTETNVQVLPEMRQTAHALVREIDTISDQATEVVRSQSSLLFMAQVGLLLLGAIATVVIVMRVNHQLLEPLAHLRNWASRMRGGNLSARIPAPGRGDFAELARDINALGADLQVLTRDMDNQVRNQTERLAQKTHSLQILYDIASSINSARDMDDLLARFLQTITELVGAVAATIRLVSNDDHMRLVASFGLDPDIVERERLVPIERCLCGSAVTSGELKSQSDIRHCAKLNNRPVLPVETIELIAVPMMYRDRVLGVYNLFIDPSSLTNQREDMKELLTSIGKHLGMAVEKARLDTESKRLSIIQERTMLAHELHDSLAQTLAGLRFQSKMLEETLQKVGEAGALDEICKIRASVEEAHTELRELLVHFRARMDERGIIPALEEMMEGFRRETQIAAFFHNECHQLNLNPDQEVQILHIVQEALTNIRKHSGARTVRLLLHCEKNGGYRILVEDDGNGLVNANRQPLPGEHVGLSIMQERARRLGGTLRVEGEPGDGTRVELTYSPPSLQEIHHS
ncbi:Sensor protein [Gammaproteobacteria bacterium]